MFSIRRAAVATAALAVGSILVMGPTASAVSDHAGLVATSPRSGATLAKAPKAVSATFTEEIQAGTITVRNARGTLVSKGSGGKDSSDVRRVKVALKPGLGSGVYKVRWTIRSADGHRQTGSFTFRVR